PPCGGLRSDRRDERVAECEDTHDLEFRLLAQTAEEPDPPQKEAQDRATRAVDARRERFDHCLRLARTARELHVRCGGLITQPEIVRDRPEQMRWIFGPALHSQIDLRYRAVPVAFEKSG